MASSPPCRLQALRGLALVTLLVLQLGQTASALNSRIASVASSRRLLQAGAGPNPLCPDAAFPNQPNAIPTFLYQCYNPAGSSYVGCQGSCGASVNNQATCADGIQGPTSSTPPASTTPSSAPPSSTPSATPPSSTPSPTRPSGPAPSPAPALPKPTPAGGAPNCPSGPFRNACFTPSGDAYLCCSSAGCGPSNQASNTASCADNKYLPIVPAIYTFGDSLVDVGNGPYLGNGDGLPFPPSPPYFPNRFSNGPVVVDYISEYLGLPFVPPFLQPGANFFRGANFATQSSGALNTTGPPGRVLPLAAQVGRLFLELRANAAAFYATPGAPSNPNPPFPPPSSFPASLYVIVTGGNDFGDFAGNATQFQALATAYVTQIAANIQGAPGLPETSCLTCCLSTSHLSPSLHLSESISSLSISRPILHLFLASLSEHLFVSSNSRI
ncbi:hypothetical protein KFL_002660170 [Klebsormidium nitens]|uniref:SGNH hydrolase-type esterase domain-containing protein n=1 Tax=Klebsormidium nitens TaxID=105231 RepID=A0A1Y1ID76_KLENI|nr:hypothetical protein KFL_002660170 [Klebsormidium nitens]|eukprot:GAQ86038.1 hypothetical protein KFL_002660170 [Klebsormidium nitens]